MAFAEVECRANPLVCRSAEAGRGGWPTIRVYTRATGEKGDNYKMKTAGRVCEELGQDSYMAGYIDDVLSTGLEL